MEHKEIVTCCGVGIVITFTNTATKSHEAWIVADPARKEALLAELRSRPHITDIQEIHSVVKD